MKREKPLKSLVLNKETIVSLNVDDMGQLVGGELDTGDIVCQNGTTSPSICAPCETEPNE